MVKESKNVSLDKELWAVLEKTVGEDRVDEFIRDVLTDALRDQLENVGSQRRRSENHREKGITDSGGGVRFIEILVHELRSPLTRAKINVDMIRTGELGGISRSQKKKLDVASRNIDEVARMIEDMIDLSRMEAGKKKLARDSVILSEVVRKAIDKTKSDLRKKEHELVLNIPDDLPLLLGSQIMLSRAFKNLLANAIQYTPKKGKICVSAEDEGENIHVRISDTGVGVPRGEQEKIFEKFYQTEGDSSAEHRGLGIGLSIVNRIIKLHKGRVWVKSAVGEGSTFHVELPKKQEPKSG